MAACRDITDVRPQLLRYPTLRRFLQYLVSRSVWSPFRGKEEEGERGEIVRPLHTKTFEHSVGVGPTHINRLTGIHSVFQNVFFRTFLPFCAARNRHPKFQLPAHGAFPGRDCSAATKLDCGAQARPRTFSSPSSFPPPPSFWRIWHEGNKGGLL